MSIVHIERPSDLDTARFETFLPPAVGDLPRPTLGSVEAWAAPDQTVETGTSEPIPKYGEIRCYIRDPDGYIIEVGQSTDVTYG